MSDTIKYLDKLNDIKNRYSIPYTKEDMKEEHCVEIMYEELSIEMIKEIERLNNIINDLLNRQNEALKYISNFLSMDNRYKHGNGNDELELVRRILNKHNEELKGDGSNE